MEQDRPPIIVTLTDLESVPGLSRKRIELINRALGLNASATARQCRFRKQAARMEQLEPA